jgi:HAE1 family hydrophobic/amphiphilic exporter-1
MRALVSLAVRRRVSVAMAVLAVLAFGWVGYQRLRLELFPDITYPSLTVQTDFPDTAPQEVENLITRPVEEAVGVLRGLQTIHSVSRPGVSEVTLQFDWDADMDALSMEVRDRLDRLVLPEEAEDPIVLRFDPALDPIVRLALSGPDDLRSIRRLAELRLKPDLETVKGIAAAEVKGGLEEEIRVDIDQERLAALSIPLDRVRQVVGVSNVNLPGGALRGEDSQFLVRTVNEFDDVQEIGNLILKQEGGSVVRLADVATVTRGAKEREVITRLNGQEAVDIDLFKEGDANSVRVASVLRERLAAWQDKLPPGYRLATLFDQSQFIHQAVSEVRNSAIIGGILAVLVLLAFLREARSTLIIATSIPISVIATFMLMYRLDVSLNIMSLGGLTLGIGMLVDSSIVVLESIFRKRRQEGMGLGAAAIEGTDEVGAAVVASTLTTVAVFLPIVFVEGIAGQLFGDQAITVTISLLASLLVAITVIPMLASLGQRRPVAAMAAIRTESPVAAGGRTGPGDAMAPPPDRTLGRFSEIYDGVVRGALRKRWLTLGIAFGLFALSVYAVRFLGTELVPELHQGEFFFEVKMPEGTALAATDRVMRSMERIVDEQEGVARHYASVGSRLVSGGLSLNTQAENLGQLNVVMENRSDEKAEAALAERLRRRFLAIPELEVKLGRPSYFSLETPVEVVLYGENLDRLREASLALAERMGELPGLVDVRSSLEEGHPELQVIFDRQRLAALGLDMGTLSAALQNRVQGVVPTRLKEEDRQIDIRVRNRELDRQSIEDIRNLVLPAGIGGAPLRLLSVADIRLARGPAEIHRVQQQRAAVITANLEDRSLGAAVGDVEELLASEPLPPGITAEIAGQNREMKVSFASLRFALLLAVFLVYLVMASTFESFVHPFIVLFTIPLAVVGVVAGLLATSTQLSVVVLIGTIMLVGIVVNNAIVLIDTINRLRRGGLSKLEAVVQAGHIRLRPILMTTSTTILGLVPMAIAWGEGAELRSPLAITVASGLFLSTLLTLVVIPAAYMVVPSRVEER